MRHVVELDVSRTRPEVQLALRPEIVRVVRRQVHAGTYHPSSDEVAELLIAWLFLPSGARAA